MIFEWDENKAQKVLQTRSIDFNDMISIFFDVRTERTSSTHNEMRWVTVGKVKGEFFAVVYTKRGEVIRIITARRARKNEERAYYSHNP